MHMDRHLGLEGGGRELEGKADLLGLLSAVSPGKKLKLESPLKQEPSASLTSSSSSSYSSMLASSPSSSLWGNFPLYPQHQAAPYQPVYPGMSYPGMELGGAMKS